MLKDSEVRKFAQEWIRSWNAHDLDDIMNHYAPEVVLTSPVAAKRFNDPSGTIKGKEALRSYFQQGLETYPELSFELVDVLKGVSSVVLYYRNQIGTMTGEFMEFDGEGKVVRVIANYSS